MTERKRTVLEHLLGIGGERYQLWPERIVTGKLESCQLVY